MRRAMILGAVLMLGACNVSAGPRESEGAGATARRDFQVGAFDRISLSGAQDVVVTVGGPPSVRAEGDAKVVERLEIRVEGNELQIGTKEKFSFGFHKDRKPVTIHVTVPSLVGAAVAGSGDIRIDKVEGERFAASIAGSGDIDIASLKVGEAAFSIGGSGGIRAAGTAQSSNLSMAGSGDLNLDQLEVRHAKVSLAGSGDVRTKAMETADVSIMGSGDVTVAGTAKCKIDKMGSGSVRCPG